MFTEDRLQRLARQTLAIAVPPSLALSVPPGAGADELRCENQEATIRSSGEQDGFIIFIGTNGTDVIVGTEKRDRIHGLDGGSDFDVMYGNEGNHVLKGGSEDHLFGDNFWNGSGNDWLRDTDWNTACNCGSGYDRASNTIWVAGCESALTSEPYTRDKQDDQPRSGARRNGVTSLLSSSDAN